ncbi:MAG: hypothetical protein AAFU50_12200, partial [Pseudomonadota bacterium]
YLEIYNEVRGPHQELPRGVGEAHAVEDLKPPCFEVTASELALMLDGIDLRTLRRQSAQREVRSLLST